MSWSRLKKIILEGIGNAGSGLEGQDATEIPQETILKVVTFVAVTESEGVLVDWIDREIEKSSGLKTTSDLHRMLINRGNASWSCSGN